MLGIDLPPLFLLLLLRLLLLRLLLLLHHRQVLRRRAVDGRGLCPRFDLQEQVGRRGRRLWVLRRRRRRPVRRRTRLGNNLSRSWIMLCRLWCAPASRSRYVPATAPPFPSSRPISPYAHSFFPADRGCVCPRLGSGRSDHAAEPMGTFLLNRTEDWMEGLMILYITCV